MVIRSATTASIALQFLAVLFVSLTLSVLAWKFDLKSSWNTLWMLGTPIAVGAAFNHDAIRARMMVILVVASFVGIGVAATLIGYG